MTVRLKVKYGKLEPNTLFTGAYQLEQDLLGSGMADTNIGAGVEYDPAAEVKYDTPVSLRMEDGVDELWVNRRRFPIFGGSLANKDNGYTPESDQAYALRKEYKAPLDGNTNDGAAIQALINDLQSTPGKQILDLTGLSKFVYLGTGLLISVDKFAKIDWGSTRYRVGDGIVARRYTAEADNSTSVQAVGTVQASGGALTGINITRNKQFFSAPVAVIPSGSSADYKVELDSRGFISGITVTSGGSGYVDGQTVYFRSTPFGQTVCYDQGGMWIGPGFNGAANSARCIQLNQFNGTSAIDPGPSRIMFQHQAIRGFLRGIEIMGHSYVEKFEHMEIQTCDRGVYFRYASSDSGENTIFDKVSWSGNNYCIDVETWRGQANPNDPGPASRTGTWMKAIGGSLDYSNVGVSMRCGAKFESLGMHYEGDGALGVYTNNDFFQLEDPGSAIVLDGQLVFPTQTDRTISTFARVDTPPGEGGLFFGQSWDEFGTNTTTGEFARGAGTVGPRPNSTTGLLSRPSVVILNRRTTNTFGDPKPDLTNFTDVFQIVDDNGNAAVYNASYFKATIATNQLTVTSFGGGPGLTVGQTISGVGVTPGTVITALGTGTGETGNYTLSISQNVGSETRMVAQTSAQYGANGSIVNTAGIAPYPVTQTYTGSITGTTLTVTGGARPTVGNFISGSGVTSNTQITAAIDTVAGTYTVSASQNVASTTITESASLRAFRVNKVGNNATTFKVQQLVPLQGRARHGFAVRMRKSVAGTVTVTFGYAIARPSPVDGLLRVYRQVAAHGNVSFTNTPSPNWEQVISPTTNRLSPAAANIPGATHAFILYDLNTMNTHNLDICDSYVSA